MRLQPTVTHLPGEALGSFASRLARINGLSTGHELFVDLGVNLQRFLAGDARSVARIAEMSENPAEPMVREACRRQGKHHALRGQTLLPSSLVWTSLRLCPECLAEDSRQSGRATLVPSAEHGRTIWRVAHLRTCLRHDVVLVELATGSRAAAHEFAATLAAHREGGCAELSRTKRRVSSPFERYLHDRLEGRRSDCWLNTLPFYAAARLCEVLGSVVAFGRTPNLNNLSSDDWALAGREGFRVAAGGPTSIEAFLEDLWQDYPGNRATPNGPQAWFGRFHDWVAKKSEDAAYEQVRDVMIRFVAERTPFNPNEIVCGGVPPYRKVHSIRTAAIETKLSGKRLRKALDHAGLLPPGHEHRSDHEVTFEAPAADRLLRRLANSITLSQVAAAWGISWMQTRQLVRAGHLRAIEPRVAGIAAPCFDGEEVERFISGLRDGAAAVKAPPRGAGTLGVACHRAQCSLDVVVGLVARRELAWVGRRIGVDGMRSILVDIAEVRARVRGPEITGLTRRQVEMELGVPGRTVNALIDKGILVSAVQRHPTVARDVVVVSQEEIEFFRKRYTKPSAMALELGLTLPALLRHLQRQGIEPALSRAEFHTPFYDRTRVDVVRRSP